MTSPQSTTRDQRLAWTPEQALDLVIRSGGAEMGTAALAMYEQLRAAALTPDAIELAVTFWMRARDGLPPGPVPPDRLARLDADLGTDAAVAPALGRWEHALRARVRLVQDLDWVIQFLLHVRQTWAMVTRVEQLNAQLDPITASIDRFEQQLLLPALAEISQSPRLRAEYEPIVLRRDAPADPATAELLHTIDTAAGRSRQRGTALVLANRTRPAGVPGAAGRYAMAVLYGFDGQAVLASPMVVFWMRFDNKLHAFDHRYDPAVAAHRVQDVTRAHVLNHVLASFDFYKLYASSPTPFPGYAPRT